MKKQLQELRDIITEIRGIIEPVLSAKHDKEIDFPEEFTLYLSLERIRNNVRSLLPLLTANMPDHDQGIGLLSRTILTDFLSIFYILHIDLDPLEAYFRLYHSDQRTIANHARFVSALGPQTAYTEKNYQLSAARVGSWQQKVANYFKEKTAKDFIKTAKIAEQVTAKANSDRRLPSWEYVLEAYEQWFYYSKYEHMGWVSYRSSRNIAPAMIAARVGIALKFGLLNLVNCLEALKLHDQQSRAKELCDHWIKRLRERPFGGE